jgi:hypothetical protein
MKRPSPPRARRAVLWGAAAFALAQLGLQLGIETCWPALRDPALHARLADLGRQRAEAGGRATTVLFLGTSRFEWGVRAGLLRRRLSAELGRPVAVANWGTGGWGLFRALLAWDRLARRGPLPDLVLVEVLPALLNERHPYHETAEAVLPACELDSADAELVLRHAPDRPELWRERAAAALVPVYSQRFHALRLGWTRLLPAEMRYRLDLVGDFRCSVPARRRAEALESARRGFEGNLHDFRLGGPGCRALEELLGRLRASGVPAALVLMPEGPAFRSWYPPDTWRQVEGYLARLEGEFAAPLLNLRGWIDEEGEFNDSHHLTAEGADRFSARLARDALAPLLRRLGRP